jgi:hypothetical protein
VPHTGSKRSTSLHHTQLEHRVGLLVLAAKEQFDRGCDWIRVAAGDLKL